VAVLNFIEKGNRTNSAW